MKNNLNAKRRFRGGFTLTEVLLAVMIVGLIAVALASLTRAAARESGVGRSKIMLRNNLSMFMRTLRQDMAKASYVEAISGPLSVSNTSPVVLLKVAQNVRSDGSTIVASSAPSLTAKRVTYCFARGTDNSNIEPSGAYRGGKIYRLEGTTSFPACSANDDNLLLSNVKYIPSDSSYPVPLFMRNSFSRDKTNSLLTVKLITELNSTPVVNDVVEETFAMPMGY